LLDSRPLIVLILLAREIIKNKDNWFIDTLFKCRVIFLFKKLQENYRNNATSKIYRIEYIRKVVISISQTVGVYFSDEEKPTLKKIDVAKKKMHMSRSGWIKYIIEKQLAEDEKKDK
jgi:hypothetical protein